MHNCAVKILFVCVIIIMALFIYKLVGGVAVQPSSVTIVKKSDQPDVLEEEKVKAIIKKYLVESPEVIIQSIEGLQKRKMNELESKVSDYIQSNKADIENTTDFPVLGNADGDVTIVAFYDYNCAYCKKGDLLLKKLLATDPNIKVILRPLPVLGDSSSYLSKIVLAVHRVNPDAFAAVHESLIDAQSFSKESIDAILLNNNLNATTIEEVADSKEIQKLINSDAEIAKNLSINGVPAYITNGKLIPGLIDLSRLQRIVQDVRTAAAK